MDPDDYRCPAEHLVPADWRPIFPAPEWRPHLARCESPAGHSGAHHATRRSLAGSESFGWRDAEA
jgi:hypothetical protein